jgi:glutamine synthetase
VIYKTGAKEIAAQHGNSLTFMAKFNEREGSSCHIHLSIRDEQGQPVFVGDRDHGFSAVFEQFLAGQLAGLRDLSYFFAPNINSYKRYQPGSFAPTAVAWGLDNRTCALRVVGHGPGLRVENRVPGGDVNPYLAAAAMIAAGLHGVEHELELTPAFDGNAYTAGFEHVPTTLAEAADLLQGSKLARLALGDAVVDHYVNAARVEVAAFNAAVTDWERMRVFERM